MKTLLAIALMCATVSGAALDEAQMKAEYRAARMLKDGHQGPKNPPGTREGTGEATPWWGWLTCVMEETATHGGAGLAIGPDDERYMVLVLRGEGYAPYGRDITPIPTAFLTPNPPRVGPIRRLLGRTPIATATIVPTPSAVASPLTVTKVIDGDTLDLSDGRRVRLHGVDAPELRQDGGEQAKACLMGLVLDRDVQLRDVKAGAWNRTEARVLWRGWDIGYTMLCRGLAWVDGRYCKPSLLARYQSGQAKARDSDRGVWATSDPIAPWDWRAAYAAPTPAEPVTRPPEIYRSPRPPVSIMVQPQFAPRVRYYVPGNCPGGMCPVR